MENLEEILKIVDDFVWGPVMLVLLVGTGIFLTFRLKFLTWKNLPYAIRLTLSKESRTKNGAGDVSPFAALTTALAATIGTGNIIGVATAMVSGGAGALVWMWISACFGLTSKFSECMLAIKYREVNAQGEMSGGPMYTMKKAIKNKTLGAVLGTLFALFAVIASFGIGNLTQANSISDAMDVTFGVPTWLTGIIVTVLSLCIIVGSMMSGMRYGIARGVFSNEAGMGSAAITAASATTNNPVQQGYINMTGTFWDTIVVCTITGLCIASSGVLGMTGEDGKAIEGAQLTIEAFKTVLGPAGGWMVTIGIALFAFSTILGWEYHGEKALEYLAGTHKYNMVYRVVFSAVAFVGATTTLSIAWKFSDIANALMAVPNLICLLALSGELAKDVEKFQETFRRG